METAEIGRTITIRLDPAEVQFLITVLKSSASILTAIMALEGSMPELSPPPITADAIAKIVGAHSRPVARLVHAGPCQRLENSAPDLLLLALVRSRLDDSSA